jgi:hypothetical protein
MNQTISALLSRMKVTPAEQHALRANSVIDAVLSEEYGRKLAEARALIAELKAVEAAHPAEQAELDREAEAAARAHDKAEMAFRRARDAHHLAGHRSSGCTLRLESQRQQIHRRLRALADPRLEQYAHNVDLVRDALKMALKFWPDINGARRGEHSGTRSNAAEVAVARAACTRTIDQVRAAQLEELPVGGVNVFLQKLNAGLAESLAPAEVNPPTMTQFGESGVAQPWRGHPDWHSETAEAFDWEHLQELDRTIAKHG